MIILNACYQSRKTTTTSDYCLLYTPLSDNLPTRVIDFWKHLSRIIDNKNKSNKIKTSQEELFELLVSNIGKNDIRFYKKCGDKN